NLHLSTSNNLIRASSVNLMPVPGLSPEAQKADLRYRIKVPDAVLVGVAFDDIFEKEEFKLSRLDILNPEIEIRNFVSTNKEKTRPVRSLPELLSAGLNLMKIDAAVVSGGSLRYI